jgi:hypothetical protein
MPAKKHHSAEFKAKVALEALKGLKTINEISSLSEAELVKNDEK